MNNLSEAISKIESVREMMGVASGNGLWFDYDLAADELLNAIYLIKEEIQKEDN